MIFLNLILLAKWRTAHAEIKLSRMKGQNKHILSAVHKAKPNLIADDVGHLV